MFDNNISICYVKILKNLFQRKKNYMEKKDEQMPNNTNTAHKKIITKEKE
jgi:hypothetical protein